MTNQEAIDLLDNLLGMIDDNQGNDYDKAIHMAIEALQEPKWIPCSERLPEKSVRVLTTDKDGEYTVNYIIDEDDGEWFWHDAVAWIPLPEPYREETE